MRRNAAQTPAMAAAKLATPCRTKSALAALLCLTVVLLWPLGEERLTRLYPLRFFSAENVLLGEFRNAEGAFGSALPLASYPRTVIKAVLMAEDARFIFHPGVDPAAMLRAMYNNLRMGKIRSGASTITQQYARTIYADVLPQNRYLRKGIEILLAVKLSLTVSKASLFEAYLNQIPMPMNSSGLAAASERIFLKNITLLSDEECVALAVLIRSGNLKKAENRFHQLWGRLFPERKGDWQSVSARLTHLTHTGTSYTRGSEHFTAWLKGNKLPTTGEIRTEISANMNRALSKIITNEMKAIRDSGADHAAVVVIEKGEEHEILRAMVGSADFFSDSGGEVNHAVRVRQAGSTLKPFVYALGFEKKIFDAQTLFVDEETTLATGREHETYRPQNNDMRFWGKMTLREALVSSRNIPALEAVNRLGVEALLNLLRQGGLHHLKQSADYYGPGLALGSGGVTLIELARLYATLSSEGTMRPLLIGYHTNRALFLGSRETLFSKETASRLTHMLSDKTQRRRAFGRRNFLDFPFPVAAKTGTSKDYRDGWIAGYTPRYTVAVWVGNSQGLPMRQVSGAWGAGRIFQQVMRLLSSNERTRFRRPAEMREIFICRNTGKVAREDCPAHAELLGSAESMPALCTLTHRAGEKSREAEPRILSPAAGERYVLHPNERADRQEIPIIIRGSGRFSYALDNEPVRTAEGEVRDFRRLSPGDYTLRVFAAGEVIEEAAFSVR